MENPFAGEVSVTLDGEPHIMKLTLGSLAELENALPEGSFVDLVERFEGGAYSPRDVLALIVAGLRGGGWAGTTADLLAADIGHGPGDCARLAGALLERAFSVTPNIPGDNV